MTDDEREDTPDDVATPDTDPRHIDPAGDLADAVETGLVEETDAGRYRLALSFGDVDGETGERYTDHYPAFVADPETSPSVHINTFQQATLDEYADAGRCSAIAVETGDRCQKRAVPGSEYCHLHLDLREFTQTG